MRLLHLAAACLWSGASPGSGLEAGTLQAGMQTFSVSYTGEYTKPVVIGGIPTSNGEEEVVVRITSINRRTKTISFYADVPNHTGEGSACKANFHMAEEFSWLITESDYEGFEGPDAPLQSGLLSSPEDKKLGLSTWLDVSFAAPIASPVVVVQIQSHVGGDFVKTRQQQVGLMGFQTKLEEDGVEAHPAHKQEVIGWIALPAGTGVLPGSGSQFARVQYEAISTPVQVTHEPYDVAFAQPFGEPPAMTSAAIFGSMATTNGGDPASLRRTTTTPMGVQIFVEEETCTDAEQDHAAEGVGLLAIGQTQAVDSLGQSTLAATLANLTPPMVATGDFISIPNGVAHARDGRADFKFRCDGPVSGLQLAFEARAPNGNDDSFFLSMDGDGEPIMWSIPKSAASEGCVAQQCDDGLAEGFHWVTGEETYNVVAGPHTFHVSGREDGTKLRAVRFINAPGCQWNPSLGKTFPQLSAAFGKLTTPMTRKDDYVWLPESFVGEGGCVDGRENRYELTAAAFNQGDHCQAAAKYQFQCRKRASVAFDYEVLAPNGSDDSFYVQIDDEEVFRFNTHRHQTWEWQADEGEDGGARTTAVEAGIHTLTVHAREDGTKLRAIRFSSGGCGFVVSNALPLSVPANTALMGGKAAAAPLRPRPCPIPVLSSAHNCLVSLHPASRG
jgi:hypothetical protein